MRARDNRESNRGKNSLWLFFVESKHAVGRGFESWRECVYPPRSSPPFSPRRGEAERSAKGTWKFELSVIARSVHVAERRKKVERVFAWRTRIVSKIRPKRWRFPVPRFSSFFVSRFHLCLSFTFQRTKERSRQFSCAIHFFSFFFWFRESTGLKYDRIRPVHENKIAINEYRLKVDETGFVESRGLDICEYAKKKKKWLSVWPLSEAGHVEHLTPKHYYHSSDQKQF